MLPFASTPTSEIQTSHSARRPSRPHAGFGGGVEFSAFKALKAKLVCTIYFANRYHVWERPINENANGLLRQFLPKRNTLPTVTQEEVLGYVDRLNRRPEKNSTTAPHKRPYEIIVLDLKVGSALHNLLP